MLCTGHSLRSAISCQLLIRRNAKHRKSTGRDSLMRNGTRTSIDDVAQATGALTILFFPPLCHLPPPPFFSLSLITRSIVIRRMARGRGSDSGYLVVGTTNDARNNSCACTCTRERGEARRCAHRHDEARVTGATGDGGNGGEQRLTVTRPSIDEMNVDK